MVVVRLVARFVALCLLAGALLVIPKAPPAAAEETGITGFMGTVQDAVIEQTVWSFTGWGLSAIGLNFGQNGDASQFDEIADELADISQELEDIDDELEELNQNIEQLNCDTLADTTSDARSDIDTLAQTYDLYLTDGVTDLDQIQSWVDTVLDTDGGGTDGVLADLETINDQLMPAGTADGIITACLQAIGTPTSGTLDDTDYYDDVADLTNFFYGYQTKGLALLVEAYHYEAYLEGIQENSITDVDPNTDDTFCADAASGTDWYPWCQYAVTETEDTYDNIQDQFALAGAPYSTDQYEILNGSPYVWVLSLEDFTSAAGDTCNSPLTTSNRCGVTVGSHTMTTMSVDYGSYDTWDVASVTAWNSLLATFRSGSSGTPSSAMTTLGLANTDNKILVTPQTSNTSSYGETICFVDTTISRSDADQPFCDSVSGNAKTTSLINGSDEKSTTYSGSECLGYEKSSWVPSDDWYDAFWSPGTGVGCPDDSWITAPGWSTTGQSFSGDHMFHWPVLDAASVTCNDNEDGTTRSTTNANGVYTMCGDDFDDWFADIVPSPYDGASNTAPTADDDTVTTDSDTADVTLSGTDADGDDLTLSTTDSTGGSTSDDEDDQAASPDAPDARADAAADASRASRVVRFTFDPGVSTAQIHYVAFDGKRASRPATITVVRTGAANPTSTTRRATASTAAGGGGSGSSTPASGTVASPRFTG